VAVAVQVPAEAVSRRYHHSAGGQSPPQPSAVVRVGLQARDAYRALAARLFLPAAPGEPAAELVAEVGEVGTELGQEGWAAFVHHHVVLQQPAGGRLASWHLRGEAPVEGLGPAAIPSAFARAAEAAARELEGRLAESEEVAAWLRGLGVEGHLARPRAVRPPAEPALRPREGWVAFGDAGLGYLPNVLVQVGTAEAGPMRGTEVGFAARVGVGGPHALAQVTMARWSPLPDDVSASLVGLELAAVLRLEGLELLLGGGVHRFEAQGAASGSATLLGALAGLRLVHAGRGWPVALRITLEVRKLESSAVPLGLGKFRSLALADAAVSLTLGAELPVGTEPARTPAR